MPLFSFGEISMYHLEDSRQTPVADLTLSQEVRQRTDHDVSDILPSIKARGVYNPVIIDSSGGIVAGARRYLAACEAGLSHIPTRSVLDLSTIELQIIELEENLRRKDLDWKDECRALLRIHDLYAAETPGWSLDQTADAVNLDRGWLGKHILVAKALAEGNKNVENASGLSAAHGWLMRLQGRKIEDAMADLEEALADPGEAVSLEELEDEQEEEEVSSTNADTPKRSNPRPPGSGLAARGNNNAAPKREPAAEDSILIEDFIGWSEKKQTLPFNLIHCDFPYGVNIDSSAQVKSEQTGSYEDGEDVYWNLLQALLNNRDNFMSAECHIVFWLSADLETMTETYLRFTELAPDIDIWRVPLIWHKTDNKGIIADAQRGPRHVYETCLLGSRGDRKIVKAISDTYGAPTAKDFHHSTKPEPMLRYFFSMLVDETTRLLDPTCGSGSALRAAESLGARLVLGLEKNQEFAEQARAELRRFRILRRASV